MHILDEKIEMLHIFSTEWELPGIGIIDIILLWEVI